MTWNTAWGVPPGSVPWRKGFGPSEAGDLEVDWVDELSGYTLVITAMDIAMVDAAASDDIGVSYAPFEATAIPIWFDHYAPISDGAPVSYSWRGFLPLFYGDSIIASITTDGAGPIGFTIAGYLTPVDGSVL